MLPFRLSQFRFSSLLTSFTWWVFNLLIVLLFPHFLKTPGGATTFLFLAFMLDIQWLFTYLNVPETKGKSLEEIEHHRTKLYEAGIK
jgi:hypothetical protein